MKQRDLYTRAPQPPSGNETDRELLTRIEALEALVNTLGAGAYTFVDEIVVGDDGDPIEFTDIPQTGRHLVLETQLAVTGTARAILKVNWSGNTGANYSWSQMVENSLTTPEVHAEDDIDSGGVLIGGGSFSYNFGGIIPPTNFEGDDDPTNAYALVSMKFGYYALLDQVKNMVWQAVAPLDYEEPISATGGGYSAYNNSDGSKWLDPVTSIILDAVSHDWAAGSRASLYMIE